MSRRAWLVCLLSVLERGFEFNHKIMISRFKSRHLVLWLLENLMVCESLDKRLVVQGKKHITFSAPYLR
jgi:hypothetical protein